MARSDSESTLRDILLALPPWAAWSTFGLLVFGVVAGFTLLLAPHLTETVRTVGGHLVAVSLPVLALVTGLLGASWAGTERIDSMVATYLRRTVGDKLEAYLVRAKRGDHQGDAFPPLFERMDRSFRKEVTSFCHYRFFDHHGRRFDMMVKSNVFNIEISLALRLATAPPGLTGPVREESFDPSSLGRWSDVLANPLVALVPATIHGSLSEGYTIHVGASAEDGGGVRVTYRFRQKLSENFLTSPYLRRYFSEDAAIATYFLYAEAFANGKDRIRGGAFQ